MRKRLDLVLVERGLFETRAKAQAAIEAGCVRVGGVVAEKPGALVALNAAIEAQPAHPWVSRGGVKLAHALDAFGVEPAGRVCLDIGASTGGFTHVLLARGAARVFAVDVGRGQLHPTIAADPRVTAWEGVDARRLRPQDFAESPSLIVADVSFIGLAKALGPPLACAAQGAEIVALIKPQFEAGPGWAPGDEKAEAVAYATASALEGCEGFCGGRLIESPIRGGDGAREFLLHARRVRAI